MMNEKGYDERQLAIRGKISFETICVTMVLLVMSAFFADDIVKFMDMSDYFFCILLIIIGYFSVRALWKDVYLGIYENNLIIFVFIISVVVEILFFIMDLFNHEPFFSKENILSFATILFQGFVIGTYIVKKLVDKKS